MLRAFFALQITILCVTALACGSQGPANSKTNSNTNSNAAPERVCDPTSDTPTEAYKRMFAAVKEKNIEKIKSEMSEKSRGIAEMMAQRQKNPVEKVYENGFTGTTFSPTLPEIRDERTLGCWGALEVRNTKEQRWEDLPYVNERGGWKFAVGEIFSGEYKSPGKGTDEREKEATNTSRGNVPIQSIPTENVNAATANSNRASAPKYDGPQVEPLPKKK